MKKTTKIWVSVALALMLVGGIIFVVAMSAIGWDFTKLSTSKYETNRYALKESFQSVSVDIDTADIRFVAFEDNTAFVVCYEQEKVKHTVVLQDGVLKIGVDDTRKWYEHIGIHFGSPTVTVYMPQGNYGALSIKSKTGDVEIAKDFQFESLDISENTGDVINYASATGAMKIKTSTGNIFVENVSASSLELSVSTGNVTVAGVSSTGDVNIRVSTGKTSATNLTCKSFISNGSTGDIILKNVIATERFSIERSTGDVRFDGCDAAEIYVETDTGDVSGNLLTEKVFFAETDTGDIDVPRTNAGGRCEIITDTGDIRIQIQ